MKVIKDFICMSFVLMLIITGCYEDKGSYNYSEWTGIDSVTGVEIPGSSYGRISLSEGELLEIDPKITFKEGTNPNDFEYAWVMGGDTIGTSLKLSWEVAFGNIEFLSGEAYFWLAIRNKVTGESWKHYATSNNGAYMVKVKIVPTAIPLIGVMIYEKADGTLEWGSIKGSNRATPQQFTTIFTEMFKRYNSDKVIKGPFVGATFDTKQLSIYTQDPDGYGTMIQAADGQTYPFGQVMGSVQSLTFTEKPTAVVKAKNAYFNHMQEILIGNELFLSTMNSDYPYQLINPNSPGEETGVEQVIGALPYNRNAPVTLQRLTDGSIYYYFYNANRGYSRQPLFDANGEVVKLDKMIGLYHEPTGLSNTKLKFFLVGKKGNEYKMYIYEYQQFAGATDIISYLSAKDVTQWAGGMSDNAIWFTTVLPVGWNYAYIAKGKDLWRYSYEGLETPTIVKSFPDDIVTVVPTPNASLFGNDESNELYTAVFTYNSTTQTGSMYIINPRTTVVEEFASSEDSIPGKVLMYLPYFSN